MYSAALSSRWKIDIAQSCPVDTREIGLVHCPGGAPQTDRPAAARDPTRAAASVRLHSPGCMPPPHSTSAAAYGGVGDGAAAAVATAL
mmetsp:Transcript_71697/g.158408  ORF Transcript_71697/g.158408 Transcript_71697/m.158408 type:complete len:88 (-) Transcript_71697:134-397(-)